MYISFRRLKCKQQLSHRKHIQQGNQEAYWIRMLYSWPETGAGEGDAGLDPIFILNYGILLFVNFLKWVLVFKNSYIKILLMLPPKVK